MSLMACNHGFRLSKGSYFADLLEKIKPNSSVSSPRTVPPLSNIFCSDEQVKSSKITPFKRSCIRRGRGKLFVWTGIQKSCLKAFAKGDDSAPSEMSLESALKVLGVAEGASFDEILKAKNVMMDKSQGNQERLSEVEAAYDALLMQRLVKRRAGKVADTSVLYADVRVRTPAQPNWFKGALQKISVDVVTPTVDVASRQSIVYAALVSWVYATSVLSSSQSIPGKGDDVPGFILAAGFGVTLFFLNKQNVRLGKAAALTTAGLVTGAIVGGVVESWLRVDIVPLLGIGSPAAVISEFVLVSLWVSSLYLR